MGDLFALTHFANVYELMVPYGNTCIKFQIFSESLQSAYLKCFNGYPLYMIAEFFRVINIRCGFEESLFVRVEHK
jgi:hypothetical protein